MCIVYIKQKLRLIIRSNLMRKKKENHHRTMLQAKTFTLYLVFIILYKIIITRPLLTASYLNNDRHFRLFFTVLHKISQICLQFSHSWHMGDSYR